MLHKWLVNSCPEVHLYRVDALVKVVDGLLSGAKLALSHLGRNLRTDAFAKYNIKCVDRLLGNVHLHRERREVYRAIARWVIRGTQRPLIVVDWSDCKARPRYVMITAAVPVGGRALRVYEEVHPLKTYNSPRTHRRFLHRLRDVLPQGCRPILVTDAGFRGPWFREVERLGWDWVGRVRNKIKYCLDGTETWRYTATLYREATPRAKHLGRRWLSQRRSYACELYLVRKYRRGRGRPRKVAGRRPHRSFHRDPWLLATSLTPWAWLGARARQALRASDADRGELPRPQGWALGPGARVRAQPKREAPGGAVAHLDVATLVYWLIGLVVKATGWMRHFQANTERRERVLSLFFLGMQTWRSHRLKFTGAELIDAARTLPTLIPTLTT